MSEISVIIPCYQNEKSIPISMDSVLAQTFTDFEVILVDDGSSDGTRVVCEDYVKRDSRVHYYYKENGGPSSARNFGIELAQSKWLTFIDADDYVSPTYLSSLYQLTLDYPQAEMTASRLCDVWEGQTPSVTGKIQTFETSAKEAIAMYCNASLYKVGPICKLIRRDVLGNIRFPDIRIAEDAQFCIDLLLHTKRVAFTTEQNYFYVHYAGSLTTKPYTSEDLQAINVWDDNTVLILDKYPDLVPATRIRYLMSRFYVLDKLMKLDAPNASQEKLMRRLIREIHQYPGVVLTGPFHRSRKLAYLMLKISPKLYRKAVLYKEQKHAIRKQG